MASYKGRVALVTGASAGIGAAIAEALVKEGVIVVGAARRVENIQTLSETLKGQPGRLIAKKLDLSKPEEIVEIFKTIEKELGGVDVLINNAGILDVKPIHQHTIEELKHYTAVNQVAVYVTAREVIDQWIRRKVNDGVIVNINSTTGHHVPYIPGASTGIYSASKYAVTAACMQLRYDLKEAGLQCRVVSISPGAVSTDLVKFFKDANLIPSYLSPHDVAQAVSFALSVPKTVEITELKIQPVNEVI